MTARAEFAFDSVLRPEDGVARWVSVLGIALNDLLVANLLLTERENTQGENVYFFRLAASHLVELAEPKGLLTDGFSDFPEVQAFVDRLPDERNEDFDALRRQLASNEPDSLGTRLRAIRNRLFHYPHLHRSAAEAGRLELQRALDALQGERGSISVVGRRVGGIRADFADEVALRILNIAEEELQGLVVEVRDAQLAFIRFAEAALHVYFDVVHADQLLETEREGE